MCDRWISSNSKACYVIIWSFFGTNTFIIALFWNITEDKSVLCVCREMTSVIAKVFNKKEQRTHSAPTHSGSMLATDFMYMHWGELCSVRGVVCWRHPKLAHLKQTRFCGLHRPQVWKALHHSSPNWRGWIWHYLITRKLRISLERLNFCTGTSRSRFDFRQAKGLLRPSPRPITLHTQWTSLPTLYKHFSANGVTNNPSNHQWMKPEHQGSQTFIFPQAKNSCAVGPECQETPPDYF
jgi:hypothetical protein